MSKLIRHAQKRGTALFLALQLTGLILLSLLSFIGGPQQSSRSGGTPAETQVSAPAQQAASAAADALQQTALTAADLTAAEKAALRKSALRAKKLYEPLASQVFNLATSRCRTGSPTASPGGRAA